MNASTKELIFSVSLDLFSRYGYSAVSIRDICKEVGIKESTVYYHYKNKKDILSAITDRFQDTVSNLVENLYSSMNNVENGEKISLDNVSEVFYEKYLMDDFCNKVIRIMSIERHNNPEIEIDYQEWIIDKPLIIQEKAFSMLVQLGYINANARDLAVQYYSPIFYYMNSFLLTGELTEEKKSEFRMAASKHIEFLNESWFKGEKQK